jgi:hypothetical protein
MTGWLMTGRLLIMTVSLTTMAGAFGVAGAEGNGIAAP